MIILINIIINPCRAYFDTIFQIGSAVKKYTFILYLIHLLIIEFKIYSLFDIVSYHYVRKVPTREFYLSSRCKYHTI